MGYRCHIATHYEVKYTGGYFNNSENELLELLEKVELLDDTWMNEGREEIEVAKTAPYARNSGFIRLSWF
ncbi:hypothetical protein O1A23_001685 [Campylobacter coli]|uniref:Uncharacterized protein n=1 Tax=Campylobacter coli 80352 TaxID=887288 RepID=A0ABN0EPE0_CAMCO|nr:hypothetical protein [Campylobacter coli]EAJ0945897.1 hypothetical protein [Campylobacter jejuni]EAJ2239368.1 hypothetical protein [Campylobacter jejuni]ECL6202262.1 hypothetical protein [Campylobacter coli]ECP9728206.1 hypothetical protein [Campylobacter coli]ECR5848052.1 hypothetical protein [Campylobacter coli]